MSTHPHTGPCSCWECCDVLRWRGLHAAVSVRWRRVPRCPDYWVSSDGRVLSMRRRGRSMIMRPYVHRSRASRSEYLRVPLRSGPPGGPPVMTFVHVAVCEAFHGPAPDFKPYACHVNGDSLDNRPENLVWGSAYDNAADRIRHKLAREKAALEPPPDDSDIPF